MWIKITVLCTIIVILTEIEANPQEKNSLHKNKRTLQYSTSHQSSRTYGPNPENRSIKIQHQPVIVYAESRRDLAPDAPNVSNVPTPTSDNESPKDQKEEGSHDVEHIAEPEHHHHTKIIERPIYIREPEPIIEIIIKESNVSLPPPPKIHIPIPKKKKEQVQVFYVKYRKNPHGHGKDSVIYDKPIPAISPPIHDEEQEEPQQPYHHYEETVTSPPLPRTTLRTIIKPDSETYHSPSGVKVTFGKEGFDYKKRSNNPEDIKRDFGPTGPREFGPTGPREFGPGGPREFGPSGPRSPPYFPRGGESQSFQQNFQFSNNYAPRENYRPEPQRHSQTERPFLAGIPQFGRKIPFSGQISSHFPQQESRFPASDDQPYKFVKSAPPRFNSQPQFSSFQQPFFEQSPQPQYSSNQPPSFRKPVAYKPFNFPQPQSPKNIQFRPHERFPTQELNFPAQVNSQQFAQNNYPNFGQQHHQSRGLAHNSQAPAPLSFNTNNHQPQIHHPPNIQNFNPYENTGPRRPLPPQPQQYQNLQQTQQQNFPQHPQYTQQQQQIPSQPPRNDYNDDKPKLLPSISKYEQHIADSPPLQPLQQQGQNEQNVYQNSDNVYYNTPPPTPTQTTTQNYKQYQKQPVVQYQKQPVVQYHKQPVQNSRPSDSPKKLTHSNQSQKSNTYKGYKSETRYSTQSTTPKYTYSKSISTTTFAPTSPPTQPTTTKDPKVLEAQLPDEVPEDLRQQLLSSGILNNADISVLDYDKVGDIPLSALPADQLANFYSAGGAQQISAASEPIPSIVKKEDLVDQEMAGSEVNEVKVKPNVEMKVVKFDPQTNEGKQIQDSYLQNGAKQSEPVVLNDEGYNKYLPIKVSGAQFPIPDVPELREKKITSVVILAPVRYDFSSQSKREVKKNGEDSKIDDVVPLELDELLRNPTSENYEKFLNKQKETKNEEQAIILLVTGPQSKDQREIFMYDVASKNVNKLEGELSSLFVEAAENNVYYPKSNQTTTESVKESH